MPRSKKPAPPVRTREELAAILHGPNGPRAVAACVLNALGEIGWERRNAVLAECAGAAIGPDDGVTATEVVLREFREAIK